MLRFAPYVTALCALLVASQPVVLDAQAAISDASGGAQAHAFDFLMGTWKVQNRFLTKRLQHSHEWLQFQANDLESPLRTGTGNLEYYLTSHWSNFIGMGLRLYDPRSHQWTIYWSDNRFSRGVLQPPVTGAFRHGRGVFEGPDHLNGVPIIVRYTWLSIDHDHAHWSQAFSRDDGRTWEINWIMDFTRIAENVDESLFPGALHLTHR